jgi:hypothetical protein
MTPAPDEDRELLSLVREKLHEAIILVAQRDGLAIAALRRCLLNPARMIDDLLRVPVVVACEAVDDSEMPYAVPAHHRGEC